MRLLVLPLIAAVDAWSSCLTPRLAPTRAVSRCRTPTAAELIDFTDPSAATVWQPVDDRIMGGASTSQVAFGDGLTFFEGELVVEGGGFASARYREPFVLDRGVEVLTLEAKADDRLGYKITLQTDAAAPGVSYQLALPLPAAADAFSTLRLPLSSFRPTLRGQPAPEAPPLRAQDVVGLGLMLSRYEVEGGVKAAIPPGRFRLALRRLTTAESDLATNGRRWAQRRPRAPDAGMRMPAHVHEPYTREDDAYLWAQRDTPPEATAEALGRGVRSVSARLQRLRNPSSEGYRRLFGSDDDDDGQGGALEAAPPDAGSLRCARECIQRIIHDPSLDASAFVVGYADRFRSLPVEVPFDQPNDRIEGRERSFVLALPQHRIVYLKFRKRLVWHRPLRLDRIFGSHGSGVRIQQVVAEYEEWDRARAARVRAARREAVKALGGSSEALGRFRLLLKRTVHGEETVAGFVQQALSPAFFGTGGGEDAGEEADAGARAGALLDLIRTLPDEHTELREELCESVSRKCEVAAKGEA